MTSAQNIVEECYVAGLYQPRISSHIYQTGDKYKLVYPAKLKPNPLSKFFYVFPSAHVKQYCFLSFN